MNQNIFLKKNYSINFRTLDRMEKVFVFRKDYTFTPWYSNWKQKKVRRPKKKVRDEPYLMVLHMLQFTQPSTTTYTTLIQPPHKSSQKQKDCRIECSKMIAIKQLSTFVDFSFLPKLHRETKKKEQTTKNDLTFQFLSQFMSAKVRYLRLSWTFFCWNKTYANFVRAWLRALGHKVLPNLIFVETILEWLVISFFEKMNNFSFSYIKNILVSGGML